METLEVEERQALAEEAADEEEQREHEAKCSWIIARDIEHDYTQAVGFRRDGSREVRQALERQATKVQRLLAIC